MVLGILAVRTTLVTGTAERTTELRGVTGHGLTPLTRLQNSRARAATQRAGTPSL